MESYKFDGGEVSLIQENIILIEYEPGKLITIHNLSELKKLRERLIGNRNFHAITDARDGLQNFSDEAKLYIANENQSSRLRLSDAVIVNSFAKKIEIELYIRFHKPVVITKTFTGLNNALRWIDSLQKDKLEAI